MVIGNCRLLLRFFWLVVVDGWLLDAGCLSLIVLLLFVVSCKHWRCVVFVICSLLFVLRWSLVVGCCLLFGDRCCLLLVLFVGLSVASLLLWFVVVCCLLVGRC